MGTGVWYNPMTWDGPWIWMWLALYFIIFCRAGATFLLGRAVRSGVGRFASIQKLLNSTIYQRAEQSLDRWGPPAVALSFLTIGFQTAMNLAAGAMRMRWYHYLPALLVGGALWSSIYTGLGSVTIAAFGLAYDRWPVVTITVTVMFVIALVGWIIWRLTAVKHHSVEKIDS